MIISRTPFRISFTGGGTDLPDFYRIYPGSVTTTAIRKYMYITVHRPFDERIRLKYSRTEEVDDVEAIEHPIVRETLKMLDLTHSIEITSVSDIVEKAGLGSSSSFTVGLLHALHAFKGEQVGPETLAREACEIELNRLGDPIGKQDQYIAAYGGLRRIEFLSDESVRADPIVLPETRRQSFFDHLMLFHVGGARAARDILRGQRERIPDRMKGLKKLASLGYEAHLVLCSQDDIGRMGELLAEGWAIKKTLSDDISTSAIDQYYEKGIAAGATGGKLLGAGGGGFLLFFVEPARRYAVREALCDLREIPFEFEPRGSTIIYYE